MSADTGLTGNRAVDVDAVVVGAGFSGIRMMIELEKLGLNAILLEAGSDVGGTWYWNRYPGARTDSLSWTYCYSFDKGLLDDWDWPHNYPERETVQAYLSQVTERFGLTPRIQFDTLVTSASYDAESNRWTVETASGQMLTCTYFITCTGHLTVPTEPNFVDRDVFEGEIIYTARWPEGNAPDLTGKRVALVGVGATGVQTAPHLAAVAENLTVFQRTPNYVLPARYADLDDNARQTIRDTYDEVWARARVQPWGFDMASAGRLYDDVTDEEREAIFEENYQKGGFFFVFESFDDIVTDERSNKAAAEFLRKKIRETVKDSKTAELLCPQYTFVAKRPPVGHRYYEIFNRPKVSLVDVASDPLVGMTPKGLKTASGAEYEADVVVIATGFDVSTGALTRMGVRGVEGRSLTDEFSKRVETYLGIGINGFPNMLMVAGPQAPGGNQPVIVEGIVEFIGQLIADARETGQDIIEVPAEAANEWTEHLDQVLDATVLKEAMRETGSYLLGANTAGKTEQSMLYLGGLAPYTARLQEEKQSGYKNFFKADVHANR